MEFDPENSSLNRGDISAFRPGQGINGRTRPKINLTPGESPSHVV
jgi:hypothetical protein